MLKKLHKRFWRVKGWSTAASRPSLLARTTGAAAACSIIEVASRPGSSSSGVRRRPLDGGLRHSDGVDAQPLCLQQRKLLLTGGTAASCQNQTPAPQQKTSLDHLVGALL
jgi:hypothetical protein